MNHRLGLTLAAGAVLAAAAAAAPARTLRTIAIDGDLADWAEVLLDDDQTVADRSLAQGDPDLPPQSQRDLRGVAATWDATNLYIYFSRTGSGTNSFNVVLYFDLGHDGRLSGADRVAFLKYSGSSFNGIDLHVYDDGGTPDVLTGDGAAPAGTAGAFVSDVGVAGEVDATGIRFEVSIAWSTLGVAPGSPFLLHPALATNTNLPAGVVDNTDVLDGILPDISLSAGLARGTAPGRSVLLPHRVGNLGTATDVVGVGLRTLLGSAVEAFTDPDGDGDPADGRLLARDANGDGDFGDALDMAPAPADDANGDGVVDGGALASGEERDLVFRLSVPPSTPAGVEEVLRVEAVSAYRPAGRRLVAARIRHGCGTLVPAVVAETSEGGAAWLAHEACNDSGAARILDVTALAPPAWTVSVLSDPDGDGDASDGVPLADTDGDGAPDLGALADGDCGAFVVAVGVPAGASGTEAVTVTVADVPLTDSREDTVVVHASRASLAPDRAAVAQAGRTIFLPHVLVNAGDDPDTFAMTSTSSLGSDAAVLDDPDGDAEPSDSTVVPTLGPMAGHGGQAALLARVRVAPAAVDGAVDVVSLVATGQGGGATATATDTITVRGLLTYSDPFFARPSTEFFGQCATVQALAIRSDNATYRFAWLDASGAVVRTSPDLVPYADGSLDDFFNLGGAPLVGTWTVKLQRRSGADYADVGTSALANFAVVDLVSAGAAVSRVDTGADLVDIAGDPFLGVTEIRNPTSADVLGSSLTYVVFQDGDGDGAPTAGEPHVASDGTTQPWAPGLATGVHGGLDAHAGESVGDRLSLPDVTYGAPGPWTLEVTWRASCGFLLATGRAIFTVGCQPGPSFDGLLGAMDRDPCRADGIELTWNAASSWGLGASGTYAVYRSEDPAFEPSVATVIAFGLVDLSFVDTSAVVGTSYTYVVRAESDVTCSTGPANGGLEDGNVQRRTATDVLAGVAPVAAFVHGGPACGDPGATVSFIDLSSGSPADWAWDLDGDGAVDATTATPSFTYAAPGTYLARLTVTTSCGSSSATSAVVVREPPIALADADRTETCVGEPIDFDGSASSGDSGIAFAAWDFDGDGTDDAAGLDPPPHVYGAPGVHATRLTVSDAAGCTASVVVPVVVHPALGLSASLASIGCGGDVRLDVAATGGATPHVISADVPFDDGEPGVLRLALPSGARVVTVSVVDAAGCSAFVRVAVDVPDPVAVTLSAPVLDPCTGTATATASVTGGIPGFTFDFGGHPFVQTGPREAIVTATLPGGQHVLGVTVSDAAGCAAGAATPTLSVPARLSGSFTVAVTYLAPGVFEASLQALASGGTAPHSFAWDFGADGTVDAVSPVAALAMRPNEVTPVVLTVTDASGCSAVVRQDAVSGGCPATRELADLRVVKLGAGLRLSWSASTDPCHGRYGVVETGSPRPGAGTGSFPLDPAWLDVTGSDADGSDQDEAWSSVDDRPGVPLACFLVRDGGTDGSWGPTGHYGDLAP